MADLQLKGRDPLSMAAKRQYKRENITPEQAAFQTESENKLLEKYVKPKQSVAELRAEIEKSGREVTDWLSAKATSEVTGKSVDSLFAEYEKFAEDFKRKGHRIKAPSDYFKAAYSRTEKPKKAAERKSGQEMSPEYKEPKGKRALRIDALKEAYEAGNYTGVSGNIADKLINEGESSILSSVESKGKRDRAAEEAAKEKKKADVPRFESYRPTAKSSNIIRVPIENGKPVPLEKQFRTREGEVLSIKSKRVKDYAEEKGIDLTGKKAEPITAKVPESRAVAPTPASAPKKVEEPAAPAAEKEPVTVKDKVKKANQSQIRKSITPANQFAIITAENPRFASSEGGNDALKKELEAKGYKVEQIEGKYDNLENPFLVETPNPKDIKDLGKKYGQESVILADNNSYKMEYTSGPKEGQYHLADKINVFSSAPDNYYSTVIRNGKPIYFNIGFNMDKLEGEPVARSVPKEKVAKSEAAKAAEPPKEPVPTPDYDAERLRKAEEKRARKSDVLKSAEAGFSNKDIAKVASELELTTEQVRANLSNQDFADRAVKVLKEDIQKAPVTVPTRGTINVVPKKEATKEAPKAAAPVPADTPDELPRPKLFVDKATGKVGSEKDVYITDSTGKKVKKPSLVTRMREEAPPPVQTKKPETAATAEVKPKAETPVKAKDVTKLEAPPPATEKGIASSMVEDVAKEFNIKPEKLSSALNEAASMAKASGESLEQAAKNIPDPRIKAALGAIAIGLTGFAAGRMTGKSQESKVKSRLSPEEQEELKELLRKQAEGK